MLFNGELALVNRELNKKWPYLEPYMAQHSGQAHWLRVLRRRIDRVMNVSLGSGTSSVRGRSAQAERWGPGGGDRPKRPPESGEGADVVACAGEGLALGCSLGPLQSFTSCAGLDSCNGL